MRVGIVTYDFEPSIGGLGTVASIMRDTLQRLYPTDTYIVISPASGADDRVNWLARARWRKSGGCPLFSLVLAFSLNRLIRTYALDLIHVHAGSGGVFLLRNPSCPVVVTSHHTYLLEAELVFHRQPLRRWWKRMMSVVEHHTYDLASWITCVSADTALCLRERYSQSSSKLVVIENCVNLRVRKDDTRNANSILYIGRLEERKGIWVLLHALKKIILSHPEVRLKLVGKDLLFGKLERFIQENSLARSVLSVGYLYDSLMRYELEHATVLVVPSVLEGFGVMPG